MAICTLLALFYAIGTAGKETTAKTNMTTDEAADELTILENQYIASREAPAEKPKDQPLVSQLEVIPADIQALIEAKIKEWDYNNPALAFEIIRRESRFRPGVCNEEQGCGSGQGLFQIIPMTKKYCEEKLGRTLDIFNPSDNLDCGLWLLKNEGIRHWDPYSGPY